MRSEERLGKLAEGEKLTGRRWLLMSEKQLSFKDKMFDEHLPTRVGFFCSALVLVESLGDALAKTDTSMTYTSRIAQIRACPLASKQHR